MMSFEGFIVFKPFVWGSSCVYCFFFMFYKCVSASQVLKDLNLKWRVAYHEATIFPQLSLTVNRMTMPLNALKSFVLTQIE